MKHSWTGGQYSVWRALLAISIALPFDHALASHWVYRAGAGLLCTALAIGFHDRLAALLLTGVWSATVSRELGSPACWSMPLLLLLHATTHGSPYGSSDARGRVDPAGGWILPRWNFAARRFLLLAVVVAILAAKRFEMPWNLAAVLLLSAVDPGWIRPRRSDVPVRVFYDGTCGLCHRFVRFLLAEDGTGRNFRLSPLQSGRSSSDSIVVADEEGRELIRSQAVLHALARLGGLWRLTAALLRIVPVPMLDITYDGVARVRHRIFARPKEACPIVPPHLARRFDS